MKYLPPLTQEQVDVWKTMPLDQHGTVRAIQSYDAPKDRDAAEIRWREWCRKTDRRWWPHHLEQWAELKGRKQA